MPEYITLFFLFQRMNYSIYGKCHPKSPEVTYLSIAETGAQVLAARASMSCRTWASQSSLRGKEEFRLFALLLVLPPDMQTTGLRTPKNMYILSKRRTNGCQSQIPFEPADDKAGEIHYPFHSRQRRVHLIFLT